MKQVLIALLLVVLVGAGCVSKPRPADVPYMSRAQIIGKLDADARELAALRADVSIYADVKAWGKRGTASGFVAIAPQNRMRLTMEVGLGRTILDVTSDGRHVYLLYPDEDRLEIGRLEDLEGPDSFLGPDTFRAAFLAEPLPRSPQPLLKKLPAHYVITVYSPEPLEGGVIRELFVDRASLNVTRLVAYDREGFVVMEVTYERHRKDKRTGVEIPRRVRIDWPREGSHMKVTINKVKDLPEEMRDRLFAPPGQEGLTVEYIVPAR